jgi:hypothetical protein
MRRVATMLLGRTIKFPLAILLCSLIWLILPIKSAFALDDTVPDGQYYFSDSNVLSSSSGAAKKDLFPSILKGKQTSTMDEFSTIAEGNFKSSTLSGDLNTSDGLSLWDYNLQDLKTRQVGMSVKVKQGSTPYTLYIPRGRSGAKAVNTAIINNAIAGIEKYKKAVKEGVLASSLANSFNIYSMYPNNQVPLADILEDARDKNNMKLGYKSIKSSGAGVTMNYSLDTFYNPLFGKMDASSLKDTSQTYWESKINTVTLTHSSDDKVELQLNADFLAFSQDSSVERESLTSVKAETIRSGNGVTSYKTTVSNKDVSPKSMIDGSMRLVLPSIFYKKTDGSGKYNLNVDNGFVTAGGIKLLISHNFVYGKEGDSFKRLGDYNTFGIDDKSLVLLPTTIDKDGNFDPKGRKVGAVAPLWFKEAVVDTGGNESDTLDMSKVYLTGRSIKFGNDYSGKISLDGSNRDLVAVDSKSNGKQAIPLRFLAFEQGLAVSNVKTHHELVTNPDNFTLSTSFVNSGDLKGFVVYRNNWYVNDKDLLTWLDSSEAKAMTEVKSDDLKNLITGSIEVSGSDLSYEDWNRLKEIKGELNRTLSSRLMSITRVVTMVFGVLIIFYSMILVMAYWLDVFNVLLEFSLLNFLTFKRLYPITSKDDIEYISYSGGDVKYVTFWNIIFIMIVGVAIGVLFIFTSPVIEFLVWVYFKLTTWVGGM